MYFSVPFMKRVNVMIIKVPIIGHKWFLGLGLIQYKIPYPISNTNRVRIIKVNSTFIGLGF